MGHAFFTAPADGENEAVHAAAPVASPKVFLDAVMAYLPFDLVAGYVVIAGAIGNQGTSLALTFFFITWALAPLLAFVAQLKLTQEEAGGPGHAWTYATVWATLATIPAFAAWVTTLPGSVVGAHLRSLDSRNGAGVIVLAGLALPAIGTIAERLDFRRAKRIATRHNGS
jgi:hypothetical protein